jgi:hypothetical protein
MIFSRPLQLAFLLLLLLVLLLIFRIRSTSELFTTTFHDAKTDPSEARPFPKTIYLYWDDPEVKHAFVKKNLEYIRSVFSSKYEVKIYDTNTILQEFQPELSQDEMDWYKDRSVQHYADFIRLYLLRKHGGIWMDASVIMTKPKVIDEIYEKYEKKPFDVFLFENLSNHGKDAMDKHDYENKYLENWFIAAPKGSPFIEEMYQEYKRALDMGFIPYKKEMKEEGVPFRKTIEEEGNVYLMQHTIIRRMLKRNPNRYRILLSTAEESMFKLQDSCTWDTGCFVEKVTKPEELKVNEIYGVKLVGYQRDAIQDFESLYGSLPMEGFVSNHP